MAEAQSPQLQREIPGLKGPTIQTLVVDARERYDKNPKDPIAMLQLAQISFMEEGAEKQQWAKTWANKTVTAAFTEPLSTDPQSEAYERTLAAASARALLGAIAANEALESPNPDFTPMQDHFDQARGLEKDQWTVQLFDTPLAKLREFSHAFQKDTLSPTEKFNKHLITIAIAYQEEKEKMITTEQTTETEQVAEQWYNYIDFYSSVNEAGKTALRRKNHGMYENFNHDGRQSLPDADWTNFDFSFIPNFTAAVEGNAKQLEDTNILLSYPSHNGQERVFCYVTKQYKRDSLATEAGDPPMSFVFTLPETDPQDASINISERFLSTVEHNPNILHALFQQSPLYQELVGQEPGKSQTSVAHKLTMLKFDKQPSYVTKQDAIKKLNHSLQTLPARGEQITFAFDPPVGERTHTGDEQHIKLATSLIHYIDSEQFPLNDKRNAVLEEAERFVDRAMINHDMSLTNASELFMQMLHAVTETDGKAGTVREHFKTYYRLDDHPQGDKDYYDAFFDAFSKISHLRFPPQLQQAAPEQTQTPPEGTFHQEEITTKEHLEQIFNKVIRVQFDRPVGQPEIIEVNETSNHNDPAEHSKYDPIDLMQAQAQPNATRAERIFDVIAEHQHAPQDDAFYDRTNPLIQDGWKQYGDTTTYTVQLAWKERYYNALTLAFNNQDSQQHFLWLLNNKPKEEVLSFLEDWYAPNHETPTSPAPLPQPPLPDQMAATTTLPPREAQAAEPSSEKLLESVKPVLATRLNKDTGNIVDDGNNKQRTRILRELFRKEVLIPHELYIGLKSFADAGGQKIQVTGGGLIGEHADFASFEFSVLRKDAADVLVDLAKGGKPAIKLLKRILNKQEPAWTEIPMESFDIQLITNPKEHLKAQNIGWGSPSRAVKNEVLSKLATTNRSGDIPPDEPPSPPRGTELLDETAHRLPVRHAKATPRTRRPHSRRPGRRARRDTAEVTMHQTWLNTFKNLAPDPTLTGREA